LKIILHKDGSLRNITGVVVKWEQLLLLATMREANCFSSQGLNYSSKNFDFNKAEYDKNKSYLSD
jgi:hypothetical protein